MCDLPYILAQCFSKHWLSYLESKGDRPEIGKVHLKSAGTSPRNDSSWSRLMGQMQSFPHTSPPHLHHPSLWARHPTPSTLCLPLGVLHQPTGEEANKTARSSSQSTLEGNWEKIYWFLYSFVGTVLESSCSFPEFPAGRILGIHSGPLLDNTACIDFLPFPFSPPHSLQGPSAVT